MRKYRHLKTLVLSMGLFFLILVDISAQKIVLLDTINRSAPVFELQVDNEGRRFYSFRRQINMGRDSIHINGTTYRPSVEAQPSVVVLDEGGDPLHIFSPGCQELAFHNDQILCFYTFHDDSVTVDGKVYYNHAANSQWGGGENMLIRSYDKNFNPINVKQWTSEGTSYYEVRGSNSRNGQFVFHGQIEGDTLYLSDSLSIPTFVNYESFYGRLDENLEVQWIGTIYGYNFDRLEDVSIDSKYNVVAAGWSESEFIVVQNCHDSLFSNRIEFPSDFSFIQVSDSSGNCLKSMAFDFVYGTLQLHDVEHFSNDYFVVHLYPNFCSDITIDGLQISSNYEMFENGILVLFNDEFEAIDYMSLDDGRNWDSRRILGVAVDDEDNLWVSGSCRCDSLQLEDELLLDHSESGYISFLATYNRNLELLSLLNLDSIPAFRLTSSLSKNRLLGYTQQRVYEIIDSMSSVETVPDKRERPLVVSPSIARPGTVLRIVSVEQLKDVESLCVYNTQGEQISRTLLNQKEELLINTSGMSKGLYVGVLQFLDGSQYSAKFLLVD